MAYDAAMSYIVFAAELPKYEDCLTLASVAREIDFEAAVLIHEGRNSKWPWFIQARFENVSEEPGMAKDLCDLIDFHARKAGGRCEAKPA